MSPLPLPSGLCRGVLCEPLRSSVHEELTVALSCLCPGLSPVHQHFTVSSHTHTHATREADSQFPDAETEAQIQKSADPKIRICFSERLSRVPMKQMKKLPFRAARATQPARVELGTASIK